MPNKGRCHGKFRASVRPDHRVHGLPEHGNDLTAEDQIDRRKDQRTYDDHDHRITDADRCLFFLPHAQAQTHEGASACRPVPSPETDLLRFPFFPLPWQKKINVWHPTGFTQLNATRCNDSISQYLSMFQRDIFTIPFSWINGTTSCS